MRILSIDGGGYLGLATASFIAETEKYFGKSFHEHFDLFCGTSTGAIIALALAYGLSGNDIVEFYYKLGARVFWNPIPGFRQARLIKSLFSAKYSNKKLIQSLEEVFQKSTLGDIHEIKGKKVLITAFSVTKGTPRVFKTDHSSGLNQDNSSLIKDIALASASAPTYFPVARLQISNGLEEDFCDGGVIANHPALLGYAEAISHLKILPDKISILSLSTPRGSLSEWESSFRFRRPSLNRGILKWGPKLANVFIDSNSLIAHQTLRRLVDWDSISNRYCRIAFIKPAGVEMDNASVAASNTLMQIGIEKATDGQVRRNLANFFE